MRLWRYWPKPRRAKIGLSSVIYTAARWGIKMNSWWRYERNFNKHSRSIRLFEREEVMTPIRLTPTLFNRTEPFRRQILLTEYLLCLEITCQVLLNDFRRLYGWGRLSSLPEANSLMVSVCQVSFGPFVLVLELSSEPEAVSLKTSRTLKWGQDQLYVVWMHALTTIGRKRKQGSYDGAGTIIRRWWQKVDKEVELQEVGFTYI